MRVRWIVRSANDATWVYQISVLQTKPNDDDAKNILSGEEFANFFNEFSSE
jgi:hypothetical protein